MMTTLTTLIRLLLLVLILASLQFTLAQDLSSQQQQNVTEQIQYCKIYDFDLDDALEAIDQVRQQDPEAWDASMRTLDEYLKNYTTTPRVTQNLDLQEFWNLLRLRVFQSYNSGGNNSSSSSSNSTSSATVDTSSSVYLMYQPTPTGNDTSNNGTVVDNLVAWRNLSSVIDCFFLGEGDLDTTGMTPLLILQDMDQMMKFAIATNLTYIQSMVTRLKYLQSFSNMTGFCTRTQQEQLQLFAQLTGQNQTVLEQSVVMWQELINMGCQIIAQTVLPMPPTVTTTTVSVDGSSSIQSGFSSWSSMALINSTVWAGASSVDSNPYQQGTRMPGYGGLAQMGYLLDMAMRAGNFFGWLSPSVPSAASSDNNSELIRVSHARSKQIVEDLLKQEKMLFAQSRVATDDDSVAEAPQQVRSNKIPETTDQQFHRIRNVRTQFRKNVTELFDRLAQKLRSNLFEQKTISNVWGAFTSPQVWETFRLRMKRVYQENRSDFDRTYRAVDRLTAWWKQESKSSDEPSKATQAKKLSSQISSSWKNIKDEIKFQLKHKEFVHRSGHILGMLFRNDAGSTLKKGSYYETHDYQRFQSLRHSSQRGYFTMSSRKSKLTQVDAQQLPFEGYGPSENNVLNPLSITDWATWFTKWYEWFFVNTEITRSRGNFPFPELPSSEYQSRWMLLGELNPQGTILEGFLSSSSSSSSSSGSSSSDCSAYDNEAVLFTNIWYCTSGSTLQSINGSMPFMEPVISGMYGTCPANFWRCAPLKSAPLLRYMLILTPIFAFIKLLFDLYMYNNNESRAEMLEDEIVDMQSNQNLAVSNSEALWRAIELQNMLRDEQIKDLMNQLLAVQILQQQIQKQAEDALEQAEDYDLL